MRIAAAGALLLIATASPALATGGMRCAPVSGSGPIITLTIGHGAGSGVVGAQLEDGQLTLRTGGMIENAGLRTITIGQSWIDERYVWLDLLDGNADAFEARLRATVQPNARGWTAVGTLVRNGRTYRVRCAEA